MTTKEEFREAFYADKKYQKLHKKYNEAATKLNRYHHELVKRLKKELNYDSDQ